MGSTLAIRHLGFHQCVIASAVGCDRGARSPGLCYHSGRAQQFNFILPIQTLCEVLNYSILSSLYSKNLKCCY